MDEYHGSWHATTLPLTRLHTLTHRISLSLSLTHTSTPSYTHLHALQVLVNAFIPTRYSLPLPTCHSRSLAIVSLS